MEAEVKKPFEDSPGSTFFRRLRYATYTLSGCKLIITWDLIVGHPMVPI